MTAMVLIPGLACSARLYAPQVPILWQLGPVQIARHTAADSISGIARSILAEAPPRFHLAGLSMGGYIAFEILRQAPERVMRLALLATGARADTPELTARRQKLILAAQENRLQLINEVLWPLLVHANRAKDRELRGVVDAMLAEVGAAAFIRQQRALTERVDSRPSLAAIRQETLVIVGDGDRLTPPDMNVEIAAGIPGAQLEIVSDCGHLCTLERPEAVAKLLLDWFSV